MSDESDSARLSAPVRGKPFVKGDPRINPGGQSKEKRAFLERLTTEDADEVYESFMALVREKNPPAVLRAVEYLAGKPASAPADLAAIAKNGNVLAVLTRDDMLAIAKGETP